MHNKVENQNINCAFDEPTLKNILKKNQTMNQKQMCKTLCFKICKKLLFINVKEIKNTVLIHKYRRFSVYDILNTDFVLLLQKKELIRLKLFEFLNLVVYKYLQLLYKIN